MSRIFLAGMVLITLVSILITGHFTISNVYERFREEAEKLRRDFLESQRNLIENETQRVIDYIDYRRTKADERLMRIVKERAYEAHGIASNIYRQYRSSKTGAQIKKLIKDALRPVRFDDGRGFYFIYTMDGVEELYAASPGKEGTNRIDLQDKNGVYVIRKEIEIVKKNKEGFSINYWKAPDGAMVYSKASFVKYFEPFDWYIGTK
ncbi:MAG: sensory box histidine kinase/response regulator protein, partial [bacterium]|nr:sensory box histidine kinase/response regulator protein [bacterium]